MYQIIKTPENYEDLRNRTVVLKKDSEVRVETEMKVYTDAQEGLTKVLEGKTSSSKESHALWEVKLRNPQVFRDNTKELTRDVTQENRLIMQKQTVEELEDAAYESGEFARRRHDRTLQLLNRVTRVQVSNTSNKRSAPTEELEPRKRLREDNSSVPGYSTGVNESNSSVPGSSAAVNESAANNSTPRETPMDYISELIHTEPLDIDEPYG